MQAEWRAESGDEDETDGPASESAELASVRLLSSRLTQSMKECMLFARPRVRSCRPRREENPEVRLLSSAAFPYHCRAIQHRNASYPRAYTPQPARETGRVAESSRASCGGRPSAAKSAPTRPSRGKAPQPALGALPSRPRTPSERAQERRASAARLAGKMRGSSLNFAVGCTSRRTCRIDRKRVHCMTGSSTPGEPSLAARVLLRGSARAR